MVRLGFSAPVARFVRAVASTALGAGMVALVSQLDTVSNIVVDAVHAIPGLTVDSEATIAVVAVAVVASAIQAADKFFRENGAYGDVLGK